MNAQNPLGVLRCVLFATLCSWQIAAGAQSPARSYELSISRQSLSSALAELARLTRLQVARMNEADERERIVGPLVGSYTVESALSQLLQDADLTYDFIASRNMIVIKRKEPSPTSAADGRNAKQVPVTRLQDASRERSRISETVAESELTTVVVVARRREEPAQQVPISINTLSSVDLAEKNIANVYSVDRNIAGVTFCCGRNTTYAWARGVPGVVGYWSEVPATLNGSGLYFDVGSIQVLKGPQGTLYGLSTNGGAILNEPASPTDRLEGYASIVAGTFDHRAAEGVLNVPVSDSLDVRIGALWSDTGGYVHDLSSGRELGGEDYWIGRASAVWKPTDGFSNYLVLNYYKLDGTVLNSSGNAVTTAFNPQGPAQNLIGAAAADAYVARQAGLAPDTVVGSSIPGGPRMASEDVHLVDIASIDLTPQVRARLIAGFQSTRTNSVFDFDMTPFRIYETSLPNPSVGATRTYTFEPQLQGTTAASRLTYVVGSFNSWQLPPDPVPQYQFILGTRTGLVVRDRTRTNGLYGEGNYALSDTMTLTAGYRKSWDERRSSTQNVSADGDLIGAANIRDGQWSASSYRLGVTYEPNTHVMIYLTNSKGYSSGGFNPGNVPMTLQSYHPESLDNFELGIKSDWSVGAAALRANLSAYYGLYDDIQVQVVTSYINEATGNLESTIVVQNAAEGRIQGLDGEFALKAFETLEVSANFSYMQTKYTRYFAPDPTDPSGQRFVDLSDLPFLFSPKWKYSVGATYHLPVPEVFGDLYFRAAYSWQDEVANTARRRDAHPYVYNPPIENLDLTATWSRANEDRRLSATLYVTNATNFHRINGQTPFYDTIGIFGWGIAQPRSVGLRLRYDF